jgi:integrase
MLTSPTQRAKRVRKKKAPLGEGRMLGINRRSRKALGVPEGMSSHPFIDKEVGQLTLVWKVVKQYLREHEYRRKRTQWFIEAVIGAFLQDSGYSSDATMHIFTRQNLVAWKQHLQTGPSGYKTINTKIGVVHTFLAWCQNNGYIDENLRLPTAGLKLPARLVRKQEVKKMPFSPEQCSLVLQAPSLLTCRTSPRPVDVEKYWTLMMLMFSGARLMEIVPLLRSDIQQEPGTGIWFFKVYEDEKRDRQVKNQFSTRVVPLHRQLLEAGFLDFVKSGTSADLFPALRRLHGSGVSYWFASLLRRVKVKCPQLSLHSCRHTTTVLLERAKVHPSIRHRLLGHSLGGGVEERVYLGGLEWSLTELREALDSITLPIEMEKHR